MDVCPSWMSSFHVDTDGFNTNIKRPTLTNIWTFILPPPLTQKIGSINATLTYHVPGTSRLMLSIGRKRRLM